MWCSGAPNSSSNHALLDTLHTLQILEPVLMQNINIQLFHDLDYNVERLEEAVDGYAQHAVGRSLVLGPQDGLVLVTTSIFASGIDKRERTADERRQLFVNGQRFESRFGKAVRREGSVDGAGEESAHAIFESGSSTLTVCKGSQHRCQPCCRYFWCLDLYAFTFGDDIDCCESPEINRKLQPQAAHAGVQPA